MAKMAPGDSRRSSYSKNKVVGIDDSGIQAAHNTQKGDALFPIG
jgi:hypothetical protein